MSSSNWWSKSAPDNWPAELEYTDVDPEDLDKEADFPAGLGSAPTRRNRGSRSRNPPIMTAMKCERDDDPPLTPPRSVIYSAWLNRKGLNAWIKQHGGRYDTLIDHYRRFVRHMVRTVNEMYQMGVTTGSFDDVSVSLGSVVITVGNQDGRGLNQQLVTFLKGVLGDYPSNKELQNFYKLILLSTPKLLDAEYHPILMCISERHKFPSETRLELQCFGPWEDEFYEYVLVNFGEAAADIDIKSKIADRKDLSDVYRKNDLNDPIDGFVNSCVGLNRMSRALFIHANDGGRKMTPEYVEDQLSKKFPDMLIHLFEYLFVEMSPRTDLKFLRTRPSIEDSLSG